MSRRDKMICDIAVSVSCLLMAVVIRRPLPHEPVVVHVLFPILIVVLIAGSAFSAYRAYKVYREC